MIPSGTKFNLQSKHPTVNDVNQMWILKKSKDLLGHEVGLFPRSKLSKIKYFYTLCTCINYLLRQIEKKK